MKKLWPLSVIMLAALAATSTFPVSSQSLRPPALSPAIEEARALAVDAIGTGELWAVWEVDDGTDVDLYFSHRADEVWSTPQPVHSRPSAWDRSPSLAVAADGRIWVAWSSSEKTDPNQTGLYLSQWNGDRWSDPQMVPLGELSVATEPALAVTRDNTVWLAWVGFDGVDEEIFAGHWDGTSWSLPQQVSTDDQDPFLYDKQPRLAAGKNGEVWLAWTGHQSGVDDEIYVSRWTGTGWTPEQMISRDDNALDVWPSLALDSRDRPWVVWDGQAGDEPTPRRRVFAAHWESSLGTWTEEEVISSPLGIPVDEEHPTLSLETSGRLHVAWITKGPSDSALGHAWYDGERWFEPRLARTGVNSDIAMAVPGADGNAQFLWIDAFADPAMPVEWIASPYAPQPLQAWIEQQAVPAELLIDPIWNRHLAFGDSITWGQYNGFYPYPARLEDKLDARVVPSEVINSGVPGERTSAGEKRISGEVSTYLPQFVIIMEGTNDVTHSIPPSEVQVNLKLMIDNAKRHSGVDHLRVMIGTLIPRLDERNQATQVMNEQAIAPAAAAKGCYLCNPWQAYYNYGPWPELYVDNLHPNNVGLQLLADTFYNCSLAAYTWLQEDTEPPVTWVEPLPAQSACDQVLVSWSGTDNRSYVVNYDVQAQVNGSAWDGWLLATQTTSAAYTGGFHNAWLGFRVRGRDVVGNQSNYGDPVYTQVVDTTPPEVITQPLSPYQVAPFTVTWGGTDTCSDIVAYMGQYKVGATGTWQTWSTDETATSGSFDPESPEVGQTYYFRASATNEANLSSWSNTASTILARYGVSGHTHNVLHQPVARADISFSPGVAYIQSQLYGGFSAYLMTGGGYELSVSRDDRFGSLPPMHITVNDHIEGLEFILPPQDDVVADGGFEEGTLATWQTGGTVIPTAEAHTGGGAVLLDGPGSWLRQSLAVPDFLTDATLSFLVRLDDAAGGSSTLNVALEGTPISHTVTVSSDGWLHVWLPVDAAVGQVVTLAFTALDQPAVLLDEVSLGSTLSGGSTVLLPLVLRSYGP